MGNGRDREEFSEVYPKMKIHRVMNGFQVIANNNVYIFTDDDRGRKAMFDFFCDWVAKNSMEKKPATNVIEALKTPQGVTHGQDGTAASLPNQPAAAQPAPKPVQPAGQGSANVPRQPERKVKQ